MQVSHLDDMSINELIALIFLADQDKSVEELEQLVKDPDFINLWRQDRERLRRLIQDYPEIEEEKHFLTAMLEAAHGYYSFSEETKNIKESLRPFISVLVKNI